MATSDPHLHDTTTGAGDVDGISPLALKVILLIAMIIVTLAFGLLPMKILQLLRQRAASSLEDLTLTTAGRRWPSVVLCLLTCLSGGVFLGAAFLNLLPEVTQHLEQIKKDRQWDFSYPVGELLSMIGFFFVFFLEEITLTLIPGLAHKHGNGGGHQEHRQMDTPVDGGVNNARHLGGRDGVSPLVDAPGSPVLIVDSDNSGEYDKSKDEKLEENVAGPLLGSNAAAGVASTLSPRGMLNGRAFSPRSDLPTPEMFTTGVELAEPERCEVETCEGRDEHPPILMASRPHAHSHGVRSVTFVLALSFHSVLEGLAFGVQRSVDDVGVLFLSLIVHKSVVAFSVGLQLGRTHAHSLGWVVASIVVLALMSPLGAVIGMAVEESPMDSGVKDLIVVVFEGLAVGTFIYVTFFEILIHERDNEHPNLLKLLFLVIGFTMIGLMRLLEGGHGHSVVHKVPFESNLNGNHSVQH